MNSTGAILLGAVGIAALVLLAGGGSAVPPAVVVVPPPLPGPNPGGSMPIAVGSGGVVTPAAAPKSGAPTNAANINTAKLSATYQTTSTQQQSQYVKGTFI